MTKTYRSLPFFTPIVNQGNFTKEKFSHIGRFSEGVWNVGLAPKVVSIIFESDAKNYVVVKQSVKTKQKLFKIVLKVAALILFFPFFLITKCIYRFSNEFYIEVIKPVQKAKDEPIPEKKEVVLDITEASDALNEPKQGEIEESQEKNAQETKDEVIVINIDDQDLKAKQKGDILPKESQQNEEQPVKKENDKPLPLPLVEKKEQKQNEILTKKEDLKPVASSPKQLELTPVPVKQEAPQKEKTKEIAVYPVPVQKTEVQVIPSPAEEQVVPIVSETHSATSPVKTSQSDAEESVVTDSLVESVASKVEKVVADQIQATPSEPEQIDPISRHNNILFEKGKRAFTNKREQEALKNFVAYIQEVKNKEDKKTKFAVERVVAILVKMKKVDKGFPVKKYDEKYDYILTLSDDYLPVKVPQKPKNLLPAIKKKPKVQIDAPEDNASVSAPSKSKSPKKVAFASPQKEVKPAPKKKQLVNKPQVSIEPKPEETRPVSPNKEEQILPSEDKIPVVNQPEQLVPSSDIEESDVSPLEVIKKEEETTESDDLNSDEVIENPPPSSKIEQISEQTTVIQIEEEEKPENVLPRKKHQPIEYAKDEEAEALKLKKQNEAEKLLKEKLEKDTDFKRELKKYAKIIHKLEEDTQERKKAVDEALNCMIKLGECVAVPDEDERYSFFIDAYRYYKKSHLETDEKKVQTKLSEPISLAVARNHAKEKISIFQSCEIVGIIDNIYIDPVVYNVSPFNYGGSCTVGIAEKTEDATEMGDRHLIDDFEIAQKGKRAVNAQLFAIFDGHTNTRNQCSNYLKDNFTSSLKKALDAKDSLNDLNVWNAMKTALVQVSLDSKGKVPNSKTAVSFALIFKDPLKNQDLLYVANLGSSRIVLDNNSQAIQLSVEKPKWFSDYEETSIRPNIRKAILSDYKEDNLRLVMTTATTGDWLGSQEMINMIQGQDMTEEIAANRIVQYVIHCNKEVELDTVDPGKGKNNTVLVINLKRK